MILVNSGSNVGLKSLPRWRPYFRYAVRFEIEREQEEGRDSARWESRGGQRASRIVLTHMHIDHDGGLADFAASTVLVSPGELKSASGLTAR